MTNIDIVRVWQDLPSRVGFFTKETAHLIPESPGIYGWFVPLWIYSNDLRDLSYAIQQVYNYDADAKGAPRVPAHASFGWKNLDLQIEKSPRSVVTKALSDRWDRVLHDDDLRSSFELALMESSILLPPLYLGKADNLATRYGDHTNGSSGFAERFLGYVSELDSPLSDLEISDLLYVAVQFRIPDARLIRETGMNELLEQVIMRFACPPFSVR